MNTSGTESPVVSSSRSGQRTTTRIGPRLISDADPEHPYGWGIAIEDRDRRSMRAFHHALRRAEQGKGQARLVFYGASHVASDSFTGPIREKLQQRFGDAGHGFVLPVHPWPSYRHRGVKIDSNHRRWNATRVRAVSSATDFFGLAGVFVETSKSGARGALRTAEKGPVGQHVELFDVFYLKQPKGGDFSVVIDGERRATIPTRANDSQPGYATFRVPDGPHELEVRTSGNGKVRLFGVAMERDRPGVILDTLGINGSRVRYHLLWEERLYVEHLRRRSPDLVVLAYGTNESGDDTPISLYESRLREVVARVKNAAPRASCLLIGPSDRPMKMGPREYQDRPRTGQLISVQHRVALDTGCGFFDLVAFQGGPLSMVEWAAADPAYGSRDHIHFTRRGYRRLADVLYDALLEGYSD